MEEGNVGGGLAMYEVTQARDRVASTTARKTRLQLDCKSVLYGIDYRVCICRLGIRWSL